MARCQLREENVALIWRWLQVSTPGQSFVKDAISTVVEIRELAEDQCCQMAEFYAK
jgi:hypothetical protein